jgi:uncharacterized protein YdeI (YjbR/CyaY-like superfamily)
LAGKLDPPQATFFATPAEFRAWLDAHHAQASELWVGFHKKGSGLPSMTWPEAVDEALCFGWIDGQARRRDAQSSFQRFTPRGPRSAWSARNVGHVARLAEEDRMRPAGWAAVEAAKADGRWERAYAGPATAEVPEDLAAAIGVNPAAQAMFDVLTAQNRFALIYRLGQVRTPAARERKIAGFVDMLARQETPYPQKRRP